MQLFQPHLLHKVVPAPCPSRKQDMHHRPSHSDWARSAVVGGGDGEGHSDDFLVGVFPTPAFALLQVSGVAGLL